MHCCFSAVDIWVYVLDIQGRAGKYLEMTIKASHNYNDIYTSANIYKYLFTVL